MRIRVKVGLLICLTGLLFYPGFIFHWQAAQDPYVYGDDARQFLPVFDTYLPGDAIPETYAKQYYHDSLMLPGYRTLYVLAAKYWDTHAVARILPYVFFLLTVGMLSAAAWRIGGVLTAGGVLILFLSTAYVLMWGYIGGTSRMFAFTFIALALWSLATDRPYILAFSTVVAAFFYPLAASICGVSLALWLLLLPRNQQGVASSWPLPKKLLVLVVTASLTIAAVFPTMSGGSDYGRRVVGEDTAAWPEASDQGRYLLYGDAVPYSLLTARQLSLYFVLALRGNGSPPVPLISLREQSPVVAAGSLLFIAIGVLSAIIVGMKNLVKQTPGTIRLVLPFAAALLLHIAAFVLQPYLYIPGRYLVYTISLWAIFLFPLALYGMSMNSRSRHAHAIVWAPVAIIFLLWGGRGDAHTPWSIVIPQEEQKFYEQIAELPENVLIAGWPGSKELNHINMDNIGFLTRRNVLLNHETHQVLHLEYMREMRQRMEAIMTAYFASNAAPLLKLREDYGVTHFLVDTAHFSDTPPTYFAPWNEERIETALEAVGDHAFLADPILRERAGILRHGNYVLLDMERIADPAF